MADPNTILLFPSPDAVPLDKLPTVDVRTCIVLDGTWPQAKEMLSASPELQQIRCVRLECAQVSEYVIRTQPSDDGLCTLEVVAHTLRILHPRGAVFCEGLLGGLRALCCLQLAHGAVVHDSKSKKASQSKLPPSAVELCDSADATSAACAACLLQANEESSSLDRVEVLTADRVEEEINTNVCDSIGPRPRGLTRAQRTQKENRSRKAKKIRNFQFALWLVETFRTSLTSVLDVAGGKGDLAYELCIVLGVPCTVVDPAPLRLSDFKTKKIFSLASRASPEITPGPALETARTWLHPGVCEVYAPHVDVAAQVLLDKKLESLHEPFTASFPSDFPTVWSQTSLVVGLHPDQPTEALVDCALAAGKPFAVVPCCVYPHLFPQRTHEGALVRSYEQFVAYLAAKDLRIQRHELPIPGRNIVLFWTP